MLHTKEFVEIGFIRKAHGFKGACKVVLQSGFDRELRKGGFVFLEIEGCMIPFEIEGLQEGKEVVLKLFFIDRPEDVLPFHQQPIYQLKEELKFTSEEENKVNSLERWVGMRIEDKSLGLVGTIERIEEYPQQWMAIVPTKDGKEQLIPLIDSFIVKADQGVLYVNLPEGLVQGFE